MKTCYLLLLFVLLWGIEIIQAQETYKKAFGGLDGLQWQSDMKEMKKNGYLVTGYTNNFGAGSYDAYCIRLDKEGKMLWSKTYGTTLSEYGTKCWGTSDAGFILLFNSHNSGSDIDSNMFVVKCNEDGNIQWSKCIKPFKNVSITPEFIYQSSEGDYYVLCDWFYRGYYFDNFTLIKLDATGNFIWEKSVSTQTSLRYFTSSQISETDKGDILISGWDEGDNYDSYGTYTTLFLFSKTGTVKLSKKICTYYCGYGTYLDPYNLTIKNNKLIATVSYNGICWFTAKLDDSQIQANYVTYYNFHTCQYLLSKGYIKQAKEGWSSNLLFSNDGSILYAYTGFLGNVRDYDIVVDKYDSLGRICPQYILPVIDTVIHQTTVYMSDNSFSLVNDSVAITDTSLTVTDVTAHHTECSGTAPSIADNKDMHTNLAADSRTTPTVQLYPNPATDILHVAGVQDVATLTIINTLGVLVKRLSVYTAGAYINIKALPAGTYYLQVQGNSGSITKPFVKE